MIRQWGSEEALACRTSAQMWPRVSPGGSPLISLVWTRATGKEPPVHPEDLEVGLKEALGWAVVTGVAMEAARLLATRAATKQVHAYQAGHTGD